MQHVIGRLEMCKGDEAKVVIGEIAELLNQDERFNALMHDFEANCPGKSEQLRDFTLGQAGFRLVDVCSERVQQKVTAAYQVLEDEVKQIKKDNQGHKISKKDQARIDALEKQEKLFSRDKNKSVEAQAKEFVDRQDPKIVIGETVAVKKMTAEEYEAKKQGVTGVMPDLDNADKKSPGSIKKN